MLLSQRILLFEFVLLSKSGEMQLTIRVLVLELVPLLLSEIKFGCCLDKSEGLQDRLNLNFLFQFSVTLSEKTIFCRFFAATKSTSGR